MSLFGKNLKLYSTPQNVSTSDAWNNKTYIKDVSIAFPMTTKTKTEIQNSLRNKKLFDGGVLVSATASLLDDIASDWMLQPKLCYEQTYYIGDVSFVDMVSQYPFRVSLEEGFNYILWDGTSRDFMYIKLLDGGYSAPLYCYLVNSQTMDNITLGGNTAGFTFTRVASQSTQRHPQTDYSTSTEYVNVVFYDKTLNRLYCGSATGGNNGTVTFGNFTNFDITSTDFYGDFEEDFKPLVDDTDPYKPAGSSWTGGGTGDFDNTSDTIGLPSLPSLSGLNTGFFTAFIPSASQMQSVSHYLWNNAIDDILDVSTSFGEKLDALKKIVANPYDAIMGCSVIPVTPPTAGSKEMKMYGLIETGISMPYASTRWVTVDCGTLNIHEFWGGYLDYSPYTKTTSLYLPYIGTVSIDIDLIMAKALQVVYRVDILSGICVAFILVDGSVKFHYQGQCATQIPITNADYSSVISAGIGLIGSASQVVGSAVAGASTGGPVGAVVGAVGSAVSQAPSVASNVMGAKPDIRSGGSVGSSAGILSVQKPYLIIERPRQSLPEYQNTMTGYPSNITASVGDLTGYTEFETINLDNLFLTDGEKEELTNILKGGVYL